MPTQPHPSVQPIEGDPHHRVIYFLPWRTPFRVARLLGFLPLPFAACYEMPRHVVSADPLLSLSRTEAIIADAAARLDDVRGPPLVIGFSIGSVPATCLANRYRVPLLSVCSAPRGADMIWQSPAARQIKQEAMGRGFTRHHFEALLRPVDPANNLAHLPAASRFLTARNDRVIPSAQTAEWLSLVAERVARPAIEVTPVGHAGTILTSRQQQLEMFHSLSLA